MSGFVGLVNLNRGIKNIHVVKEMNLAMKKKNSNKENYFINTNINIGYTTNEENNKQLLNLKYNDTTYTIVYNGQIYNKDEIIGELQELGYYFTDNYDTEIILKAFIHFGTDIIKRLNGVFSFVIWNNKTKDLLLVRDHFGIKPLYYTVIENTLIFATEIKGILAYPKIEINIDKQGICELIGLRTSTYSRNYYI